MPDLPSEKQELVAQTVENTASQEMVSVLCSDDNGSCEDGPNAHGKDAHTPAPAVADVATHEETCVVVSGMMVWGHGVFDETRVGTYQS